MKERIIVSGVHFVETINAGEPNKLRLASQLIKDILGEFCFTKNPIELCQIEK
jgi:hypothetical protein